MFLKCFVLFLTIVFALFTVLTIKMHVMLLGVDDDYLVSNKALVKQVINAFIINVGWLVIITIIFGINTYLIPLSISYVLSPVLVYLMDKPLSYNVKVNKLLIIFEVILFAMECLGIVLLSFNM